MTTLRTIRNSATLITLTAFAASATTIVGNQIFTVPLPALFAPATPGHPSSGSVDLSQFNINLQNIAIQAACPGGHTCSTLTFIGVDFEVIADSNGTLVFANANAASRNVSFNAGLGFAAQGILDLTMTDPNSVVVTEVIPTFEIIPTITIAGHSSVTKTGTGHADETGNIDVATGAVTLSNGPSDTLTLAQIFNTYVGLGSIHFGIDIDGTSQTGPLPTGVTIPTNDEALTGVSAQVTYTYSYDDSVVALPEPASMILLGSALIGVAVVGRKRLNRS